MLFSVAESKLDRVFFTTLKMVGETATTVYGRHRLHDQYSDMVQ